MSKSNLLSIFLMLFIASATSAAPMPACEGSPKAVGACYIVHGRLSADYQGTSPDRIWITGTRQLLALTDESQSREHRDGPILPANVQRAIAAPEHPKWVYGTFRVCPFEKQTPGVMRHVCLQSGSGLATREMRR